MESKKRGLLKAVSIRTDARARTELANLVRKKADREDALRTLERQIYAIEGRYLRDSVKTGNMVRGWDPNMGMPTGGGKTDPTLSLSTSPVRPSRQPGRSGRPSPSPTPPPVELESAPFKQYSVVPRVDPADRIFSKSSVTSSVAVFGFHAQSMPTKMELIGHGRVPGPGSRRDVVEVIDANPNFASSGRQQVEVIVLDSSSDAEDDNIGSDLMEANVGVEELLAVSLPLFALAPAAASCKQYKAKVEENIKAAAADRPPLKKLVATAVTPNVTAVATAMPNVTAVDADASTPPTLPNKVIKKARRTRKFTRTKYSR